MTLALGPTPHPSPDPQALRIEAPAVLLSDIQTTRASFYAEDHLDNANSPACQPPHSPCSPALEVCSDSITFNLLYTSQDSPGAHGDFGA